MSSVRPPLTPIDAGASLDRRDLGHDASRQHGSPGGNRGAFDVFSRQPRLDDHQVATRLPSGEEPASEAQPIDIARLLAEAQLDRGDDRKLAVQTAALLRNNALVRAKLALDRAREAQDQAMAAMREAAEAQARAAQTAADAAAAQALAQAEALSEQALATAQAAAAQAHAAADGACALALADAEAALQKALAAVADAADVARELRSAGAALGDAGATLETAAAEIEATAEQLLADATELKARATAMAARQNTDSGASASVLVEAPEPEVSREVTQALELAQRLRSESFIAANAGIAETAAAALEQLASSFEPSRASALAPAIEYWSNVARAELAAGTTQPVSASASQLKIAPADEGAAGAASDAPLIKIVGQPFYAIGDRNDEPWAYEWLPADVAALARANPDGHVLLTSSDQITTVAAHLDEQRLVYVEKLVTVIRNNGGGDDPKPYASQELQRVPVPAGRVAEDLGLTPDQARAYIQANRVFVLPDDTLGDRAAFITAAGHPPTDRDRAFGLSPEVRSTHSEGSTYYSAASYGREADHLAAIGLSADVPRSLTIAFNASRSGGGDASLDESRGSIGFIAEQGWSYQAYHAIADDSLARDWVQIGDKGPIGDDMGKILEKVFEEYGADTEEKKELVRGILFRYDERFGVIANRELVEAAVNANNNRRQGFFENSVGRAIIMVLASFVPGAGPALSAAISAAFTLADGGSFLDALRAGVAGYLGSYAGSFVGEFVSNALGPGVNATVRAGVSGATSRVTESAVRQLIQSGRVDPQSLIAAALSGGVGGAVTQWVSTTEFAQRLDESLDLRPGTTARFVGGQAGSLASGQGLSPTGALSTLAGGIPIGDADATHEEVLDILTEVLPTLDPEELLQLESDNFGFGDVELIDELPAEVEALLNNEASPALLSLLSDADISRQELERASYTKDADGLETWRNPDTNEVVYMRSPDGATLAVAAGRSVLRDGDGRVVSVSGGTFGEAFALARASGATSFEYTAGAREPRLYSTTTREDVVRANGGSVTAYREYVQRTGDHSVAGFDREVSEREWQALAEQGVDIEYFRGLGYAPQEAAAAEIMSAFARAAQPGGTGPHAGSDADLSAFARSGLSGEFDTDGSSYSPGDGNTLERLGAQGQALADSVADLARVWKNWDKLPERDKERLIAAGVQVIGGVFYIGGVADGVRLALTGKEDLLGEQDADTTAYMMAAVSLIPGGKLPHLIGRAGDALSTAARAVDSVDSLALGVARNADSGRAINTTLGLSDDLANTLTDLAWAKPGSCMTQSQLAAARLPGSQVVNVPEYPNLHYHVRLSDGRIVDPTWQQFFNVSEDAGSVFVGTREEMIAVLDRALRENGLRSHVRGLLPEDPVRLYELIWGPGGR